MIDFSSEASQKNCRSTSSFCHHSMLPLQFIAFLTLILVLLVPAMPSKSPLRSQCHFGAYESQSLVSQTVSGTHQLHNSSQVSILLHCLGHQQSQGFTGWESYISCIISVVSMYMLKSQVACYAWLAFSSSLSTWKISFLLYYQLCWSKLMSGLL